MSAFDETPAAYWARRAVEDAPVGGAVPIALPGGRVTLRRVEPGRYDHHDGRDWRRMANRSRFAVEVDGTLRGHVAYPAGFGVRWRAWTLGNVSRAHNGWDVVSRRDLSDRETSRGGRDGLALRFVGWAEAGLAPTEAEIRAVNEEMVAAEVARAAAWAETKARQDADAGRERARREAEAAAAAVARRERGARAREALASIREDHRGAMTDAQLAGLEDALAALAEGDDRC